MIKIFHVFHLRSICLEIQSKGRCFSFASRQHFISSSPGCSFRGDSKRCSYFSTWHDQGRIAHEKAFRSNMGIKLVRFEAPTHIARLCALPTENRELHMKEQEDMLGQVCQAILRNAEGSQIGLFTVQIVKTSFLLNPYPLMSPWPLLPQVQMQEAHRLIT